MSVLITSEVKSSKALLLQRVSTEPFARRESGSPNPIRLPPGKRGVPRLAFLELVHSEFELAENPVFSAAQDPRMEDLESSFIYFYRGLAYANGWQLRQNFSLSGRPL